MANEAGVVKSVTGGSVRAINDATGEVRHLSVGDIVYQNEKIVTDSADSKVTITQTDGKDITLIGKDTITLDQDSGNNQTVADISALQQAILNGTDLNALEETAAGGPQAGNAGGDGVSLGAASFVEGGHYSNISENFRNLNGTSRNFESPINSVGGYADGVAGTDVTTPVVPVTPAPTVTMLKSEAMETKATEPRTEYLIYNIELAEAKTTFNLNVAASSNNAGNDYSRNLEYSFDGGNTWEPLVDGKISANGPAPIQNIQVRIKVIDDDGRINGNQNEGVKAEDRGAAFGADDYGVYKNGVTLSVTDGNSASASATGNIIDNDDILTSNKYFENGKIDTEDGEDTITLNAGTKDSKINLGSGADKMTIGPGANVDSTFIDTGTGDDKIYMEKDSKTGKDSITKDTEIYTREGNDTVNIDGKFVSETKKTKVETGTGDDTINVSGEVIGNMSIGGEGQVELNTDSAGNDTVSGNDTVNITTGSNVSYTSIDTGWGDDKFNVIGDKNHIDHTVLNNVNVNLEKGADNVKIENATLHNVAIDTNDNSVDGKTTVNVDHSSLDRTKFYTGDDNDTVSIRNTVIKDDESDQWGSTIRAEGGDDTVNIESSNISGKKAEIDTDNYRGEHPENDGNDTLDIKDNTTIDGIRFIKTGGGDDIVHVTNSTISNIDDIDGLAGVNLGKGNDTIAFDGSSKLINTNLGAGDGNDTVVLGKDVELTGTTHIDGGAGNDDTLQISENIDFSKVSNFEHLKLGADNESVDLKNLSIGDVLNITGNKDTVLKIDGDRSDHLSLKGFNNTPVSNHDGYDRYEGFDSYGNTISIDIKQGVAIDFY